MILRPGIITDLAAIALVQGKKSPSPVPALLPKYKMYYFKRYTECFGEEIEDAQGVMNHTSVDETARYDKAKISIAIAIS